MISLALQKCLKNGVKIYPVHRDYRWYIEVDFNGRKTTIEKPIKQSEINSAMEKTVLHYSRKL